MALAGLAAALVAFVALAGFAAAPSAVAAALRGLALRAAVAATGAAVSSSAAAACLGAGAAFLVTLAVVALAVVARDAGVAERAAATRRRVLAEPSTTTVTPASESARRSFLAWAGFTSADSTVRASCADVSCPPAFCASAIRVSVSERTSAPVWRGSVTNDLPEAMSEHGRIDQRSAKRRAGPMGCWSTPVTRTGRLPVIRGKWVGVNCNAVCGDHPAAHGPTAAGAADLARMWTF